MNIPVEKWVWFGQPAHFIGAANCLFHMATQVGHYLISSVGDYRPDRRKTQIGPRVAIGAGPDAFFETYVFDCGNSYTPCEAIGCGCQMPTFRAVEIDGQRSATSGECQEAHLRFCKKYATKAMQATFHNDKEIE